VLLPVTSPCHILPSLSRQTRQERQASREGIRHISQAKRQQVNGGAGRQMNKKIGGWLSVLMNGGSNFYNYILTVYLKENEIIRESFLSV